MSSYEFSLSDFSTSHAPREPSFYYSEETKKKPKLHTFLGRATVPAGSDYQSNEKQVRAEFVEQIRELQEEGYALNRLSLQVNGQLVDCLIVGLSDQLDNGRWILNSLPNLWCFEEAITFPSQIERIKKLGANIIYFNYPGVGCSEGKPHQSAMIATYHAVLEYLENRIGAREILMWGTSIGGGVQGAALHNYHFKEGIKYLSIIDQSFDALNKVPTDFLKESSPEIISPRAKYFVPDSVSRLAAKCLKKGGWTLESVSSAIQLEQRGIRQIIIQNTRELTDNIQHAEEIVGDGVIAGNASLGKALLNIDYAWTTKRFVGVTTVHATGYTDEEERMIRHAIRHELRVSEPYGFDERNSPSELLEDGSVAYSWGSTSSSRDSLPPVSSVSSEGSEIQDVSENSEGTDQSLTGSFSSSSSADSDSPPRISRPGSGIQRSSIVVTIQDEE